MKRILKIMAVAFFIVAGSSLQNNVSAQSRDDVSYQTFYDQLSPYGDWIDYPDYGYVWQPRMGEDFRPYSSGGHWVWSDDYEWMWVSDYDWGWAPFHYGRWFSDPNYGWLWVPGYEWSSAWVAWRDGGDYYGWAPLRPGINIGVNFSMGNYSAPDDYWCFTPRRYLTSYNVYDHCIDRRQNGFIINNTIIINNFNYGRNGYVAGPRRYDAERYTGRINPVQFRESNRPGRTEFRNNEVSIYRPNVQHNDAGRFTPHQFDRYDRQGNNDNRTARNDNGSRRNDVSTRRDDNINGRNNNFPDRGQRDNNLPVDRRDNNPVRQPQDNNGNINFPADRRRFDRNDNNNRQPDRTINNPSQRPDVNTGNGNNNDRRFDQRNNNGNIPYQQPARDRRDDNNNRPQRQPQQQQVEQRRQPEQPRQFERRDDGNRPQNNGGNQGNGRRRF